MLPSHAGTQEPAETTSSPPPKRARMAHTAAAAASPPPVVLDEHPQGQQLPEEEEGEGEEEEDEGQEEAEVAAAEDVAGRALWATVFAPVDALVRAVLRRADKQEVRTMVGHDAPVLTTRVRVPAVWRCCTSASHSHKTGTQHVSMFLAAGCSWWRSGHRGHVRVLCPEGHAERPGLLGAAHGLWAIVGPGGHGLWTGQVRPYHATRKLSAALDASASALTLLCRPGIIAVTAARVRHVYNIELDGHKFDKANGVLDAVTRSSEATGARSGWPLWHRCRQRGHISPCCTAPQSRTSPTTDSLHPCCAHSAGTGCCTHVLAYLHTATHVTKHVTLCCSTGAGLDFSGTHNMCAPIEAFGIAEDKENWAGSVKVPCPDVGTKRVTRSTTRCAPIREIPYRVPQPTHIYTFWEGIPIPSKQHLAYLVSNTPSIQSIFIVQKGGGDYIMEDMAHLGFKRLVLVHQLVMKACGGKESFRGFIFEVLPPPPPEGGTESGVRSSRTHLEHAALITAWHWDLRACSTFLSTAD